MVPKQFEKYIERESNDFKFFYLVHNFTFEIPFPILIKIVYGTGQQSTVAEDVTENWDLYDTLNSTKLEQMSDEEDEQEYNSDDLSGDE